MDNRTAPFFQKEEKITKLRQKISICNKCEGDSDKHLVNVIAANHNNAPKGIGYWSDAYPNLNADLMIVGQDWGSEGYLSEFVKKYNGRLPDAENYWEDNNPTWENLMDYLLKAGFETEENIAESFKKFKNIYLTNSVLCLRKGNKITGDIRIEWINNCYQFLKKQIDIVRPKIIATLGQKVFDIFSHNFGLKHRKFTESVSKKYIIEIKADEENCSYKVIVVPLYHTGYYGSLNRRKASSSGKLAGDAIEDFRNLKDLLNNVKCKRNG